MLKLNNIYLLDVFKFLASLDDKTIDLAIIDPPYNQSVEKWDTFKTEKEYFEFTFKWIDMVITKIKDTGSVYIFNNPYNSAIIFKYLADKGLIFKNWIIWNKKDGFSPSKNKYVNNQEVILFFVKSKKYTFNADAIRVPYESESRIKHATEKGLLKNGKRWYPNKNGKLCSDVWNFSSDRHNKKINGKIVKNVHPTPKPEELIKRIVTASSNKDDVVLDLFSGTGTTSFIAKQMSRKYLAVENNLQYYNIIIERLK